MKKIVISSVAAISAAAVAVGICVARKGRRAAAHA